MLLVLASGRSAGGLSVAWQRGSRGCGSTPRLWEHAAGAEAGVLGGAEGARPFFFLQHRSLPQVHPL